MDYCVGSVPMQINSENPGFDSWIKDRNVATPLTTEHKNHGYELKPRSFYTFNEQNATHFIHM
jgi:hypothetical protein